MKLKGNFILTDPCYINFKKEDYYEICKCDDGVRENKYGYYGATLIGDWSAECISINEEELNILLNNSNEECLVLLEELFEDPLRRSYGKLCADAGLFCMFDINKLKEDGLNIKPECDKLFTNTKIMAFDGEITHRDIQYKGGFKTRCFICSGNDNFVIFG